MPSTELLPIAREEKARADALQKLLSAAQKTGASRLEELEARRKDSVRLQALRVEYAAVKRTKAELQRHSLLDAARVELQEAGLHDFPLLFAKAIGSGRLPPGCIFAQRLSAASRNVNVGVGQRRYPRAVMQHLVYAHRSPSAPAALTALNSSNTSMAQRGEPMPSRKAVQTWIKKEAGATSGGVRMGFLPRNAVEFANHLCTVEAMQASLDPPAEDVRMLPDESLPVVPYRVATDAEGVEAELHVNRRTGAYTGDEDLSDIGFGTDPKVLAAERRRMVQPLEQIALGKYAAGSESSVLAKIVKRVHDEAAPANDAEVARLQKTLDARMETYQRRLAQKGKGARRQAPKPKAAAKKKAAPRGAKTVPPVSTADASGPAAGVKISTPALAGQLVGRVVLQLFPDDPVSPKHPFRGRISELLPVERGGEYAGQLWVKVEYEDGDEEERHVDELLKNAHLVSFAEMSSGEMHAAAPASLLAELKARGLKVTAEERADGGALAAKLLALFRPPAQQQQKADADDLAAEEEQVLGDDAEEEDGGGGEEGGVEEEAGAAATGDAEENEVADDDTWGERQLKYNAKQVAELGQLQAALGTAVARQKRCQALLEQVGFQPEETDEALAKRLEQLPPMRRRNLALALQQEIEDLCRSKRVAADKLIVWRARDLLHMRSVTVARFWFKGSLTALKIDAMRRFVLPRLESCLRLHLCGVLVPRLLFLVADKEACNECLALNARRDDVPTTPRELAKEVEKTVRAAKKESVSAAEQPPCEQHWDQLSAEQRFDAVSLGFDKDSWLHDCWDEIDDDWHELDVARTAAAQRLGFDSTSWWGGAATLANQAAALDSKKSDLPKKKNARAFILSRAPSKLPPLTFDVLGMQLHSLHPSWVAPWVAPKPQVGPESAAVRTCVVGAIERVKARRLRESDEGAEEEELRADQTWFAKEAAGIGLDDATRKRRVKLPHGMRMLSSYLNALRAPRPVHVLERLFPLSGSQQPGGAAQLGGSAFDFADAYASSQLPHTSAFGAVSTCMAVGKDRQGGVRVRLELGTRPVEARRGFVTSSQLILERRVELAVSSPAISAAALWDVAADMEMHARRIELAESHGVRYERGWYHPFDRSGCLFDSYGHFSCQSHDMKTSGHLLAGMAGKKEEQVVITHAHLLDAANTLAEADRTHVPMVGALRKTVDMHSQAVFGNLFSTRALLDLLRSRGQWREWSIMTVLHHRWRAWDQRGISPAERVRCIEVLPVLLDANLMGGAMFRPSISGEARARGGLLPGVRSGMFRGFSWQTVSARLAGAAMHALVRQEVPRYALTWCQRTAAQNDVESLFGHSSACSSSKVTPLLLGPRLDELDVLDWIKHDPVRARSSTVNLSKKKAYDPVEGIGSKQQAVAWASGDGNARTSQPAEKWEYGQRQRAIAAAAGKQQTVRMDNTFRSRGARESAKEAKRPQVVAG